MAKFTYRMQNILDIKVKMENQAKIAYGIANSRLVEEQQKLQAILMRRAGYERKAKELVLDILSSSEFVLKDKEISVYVGSLAASSVDLGIRYYTKNADYAGSKGIVLEKVKEAFDNNHIEIPYQQLDVHMK